MGISFLGFIIAVLILSASSFSSLLLCDFFETLSILCPFRSHPALSYFDVISFSVYLFFYPLCVAVLVTFVYILI